jgi:uncharacterized protein YqjF (DUF2071 family)
VTAYLSACLDNQPTAFEKLPTNRACLSARKQTFPHLMFCRRGTRPLRSVVHYTRWGKARRMFKSYGRLVFRFPKYGEHRCSRSSSRKRYSSSRKRDRNSRRYSHYRPTGPAHSPLPTSVACRRSFRSRYGVGRALVRDTPVSRGSSSERTEDFSVFQRTKGCVSFGRLWLYNYAISAPFTISKSP